MISIGQHFPGIVGSQTLRIGVHWTQLKRALRPMAMFMEMRMNQTPAFVHPVVKRSMVKAKLVLDQAAHTRSKVPAALTATTNRGKFSNGKSQTCSPYPRLTQYVRRAAWAARQTWQNVSVRLELGRLSHVCEPGGHESCLPRKPAGCSHPTTAPFLLMSCSKVARR